MADRTRHPSTYSPFCADISTYPSIDYTGTALAAVRLYPGAKDEREALVFALKHKQMEVEKAIRHYSEQAHRIDDMLYAKEWCARYLHWLDMEGPANE